MSTLVNRRGGFPPLKYCPTPEEKAARASNTKQRFFSNAPKQNINVRQLLTESTKKPVISIETTESDIEVIDTI